MGGPFQGVGGCEAWRLVMCIALSVSVLKMFILGVSDCKSDWAG